MSKTLDMKEQERMHCVNCKLVFNTNIYIGRTVVMKKSPCPQMPQKNAVLDSLTCPII